jgi:type III secretory pathway lipoprotein EscJ
MLVCFMVYAFKRFTVNSFDLCSLQYKLIDVVYQPSGVSQTSANWGDVETIDRTLVLLYLALRLLLLFATSQRFVFHLHGVI